ncbi:hypothetical protein JRO89_XS03G0297000 [Xanthoceras sorbifolium]|uniref:Uncharacterized protein n=1 Tax=Xanthoceras sorbifolium TaxID=99658 RepID=A0ABQ8ICR1_9ROSI|nr:hypothetical protein JRO89_XS03G0297000 [Xanthoceras sorbifolium]
MGRTPCCSKEGLNRGAWTADEDQILRDYINIHGEGKWRTIPKEAGDQVPESKQSKDEQKKKKKKSTNIKTPPLSSHIEANTETYTVKAEAAATNERVADNNVQVRLKCNDGAQPLSINKSREDYAMEYNFGELLLSDFPDSDFWKLCQNNCTEKNDRRTTGPGTTRLSLEHPVLFSEDLLRDWIRDSI